MYAIKIELKLNNSQQALMAKHAGFSRFIYNYGLALYNGLDHKVYKGGVNKKLLAIKKVLTGYTKKQVCNSWMNKLSSRVYQNALRDLNKAFSRYFDGRAEKPVFKKKKDKSSFTVDASNGLVLLDTRKRIKIPTLGTFRLKESLTNKYVTQTFTISRTANKWYVSFTINAERIPPLYHEVTEKTGIDLGVKLFATLSDHTTYTAPKLYKKAKTKLGKKQYHNRNKQLGNRKQKIKASNNAKKFYAKVACIHADIANVRNDFLHKTTTEISKKYSHIRIEDLNLSGMIANHKLARAISDLGLYEFRRQLIYKSPIYGTTVELVDRWYPSSKTCNACGHIQPMPLKERTFVCQNCNYIIDRDLGAAINLANVPDNKVRLAKPEVTPVDKKMPTSLDEAGIGQHGKLCVSSL